MIGERKVGKGRRFFTFALVGLALVLLLGQALGWWLARPQTQEKLGRFLSAKLTAQLGMDCQVDRVRVHLYPLQVQLANVRLGPAPEPVVQIARAQVNWGSWKVGRGELQANLVYLKGLEVSSKALAGSLGGSGKPSSFRLSFRQLVVEDARVDQVELAPELSISASQVELLLSGPGGGKPASFAAHIGRLELRGASPAPLSFGVASWGQLGEGKLEVKRLRLSSPALWAEVTGGARWQGEKGLDLAGAFRGTLEEVDRFFHLGIGLQGQVEGKLQLAFGPRGFVLDAEVQSQQLEVVGLPVAQLRGSVHLTGEGIEASLEEGLFAGGRVEGSYQLADFGPTFAHRVALQGEGIAVERFLPLLGIPPAGLASRARVNAKLSFQGAAIGQGQGIAYVSLSPAGEGIPARGELVISLTAGNALNFQGRALQVGGGVVHWQGPLTLGTWQPRWSLASEGIPVEVVGKLLSGWVGVPVLPAALSGTAVFDVNLAGSFTNPTVEGSVAISPVCLGPLEADGVESQLRFAQGVLRLSSGKLFLGKGKADFSAELDLRSPSPLLNVSFTSRMLPLARMAGWAGLRFPLSGTVALQGKVGGTLENPTVEAQMGLAEVQVVGLPLGSGEANLHLAEGVLQVRGLRLGGLSGGLEVDFANRHVDVQAKLQGLGLEPLSPPLARILGGQVEAELVGEFPWDAPAGRLWVHTAQGAEGQVVLDAKGLRATLERAGRWQLSAEIGQRGRAFSGQAHLAIESLGKLFQDLLGQETPVDGSLRAKMDVSVPPAGVPELSGQITEASLSSEGEEVFLVAPAAFTLRGSQVEILGLEMQGPTANVFFQGKRESDGSLQGKVAARLPASLLGLFWREAAPRGKVELLGELSGSDQAPRLEGSLQVSGGSLRVPGLPAPVTAIEGSAQLSTQAITLQDVRFAFSGGLGTCTGQIRLGPQVELDLALGVTAVRWPLTQGFTPSLDGTLRLTGDLSGLQLGGELTLRRSVYQREVNLQRLVLDELTARSTAPAAAKGLVAFDVKIHVPGTLEVRTPMARIAAQGELRLVGDSAQPGLLGRLEVFPGGELELSGVTYEVERASVSFTDPTGIRPVLDLQAYGTVENFTLKVGLAGTLDRLVPTLSSDPPLPEADILALMALGVNPSSVAATTSASTMASSFLTEQLTGAVTQRTRTLLALDQLRIDPFVTTESGTPTARVTAVKQLSPDWSVTVSTNLSSNREEVVVSRWRIAKDVFLEATRDSDGSYSLEVRWRRQY